MVPAAPRDAARRGPVPESCDDLRFPGGCGDEALRDALRNAWPGIFDPRSWSYWHTVLGMLPVPPMRVRQFPAGPGETVPEVSPAIQGHGGPPEAGGPGCRSEMYRVRIQARSTNPPSSRSARSRRRLSMSGVSCLGPWCRTGDGALPLRTPAARRRSANPSLLSPRLLNAVGPVVFRQSKQAPGHRVARPPSRGRLHAVHQRAITMMARSEA